MLFTIKIILGLKPMIMKIQVKENIISVIIDRNIWYLAIIPVDNINIHKGALNTSINEHRMNNNVNIIE